MLNIIKGIILEGWRVLFYFLFYFLRFSKHPEAHPITYKYQKLRHLIHKVLPKINGELHVVGKENIPNGTVCFISNHINLSDPILFIEALESPTTFVCKKEIKKLPIINKCVDSIEGEYIDRENLKESLRTMMKVEASLKKGDKNWLIFAEGTRNKDERHLLLDFHHGTFRAPTKAKVPLVPCAIYGSQRLVSKKQNFPKYPLYLEFGKPLMPEEYETKDTQEVAQIMQSRIQEMISYHARQYDKKELVRILGDKYKENY